MSGDVSSSSESSQATAWTRLRENARTEGTKPSTAASQAITPSSLAGSYSSVWDSHVGQEALDDLADVVSWLHLTVDAPQSRNTHSTTPEGDQSEERTTVQRPSEPTFADIQGRFKWWEMVGSFKGLYRPENAGENIWLFGGVQWRHLTDDEGGSDEHEESDLSLRNTDDFGLAALVTLDDSGKPFLEMLYNATLYYQKDRLSRSPKTSVPPSQSTTSSNLEYVRILWKKLEVDGDVSWIDLTDDEAKRVSKHASIDLSETRNFSDDSEHESDNEDNGNVEASTGTKRKTEDGEDGASDNASKRARV